MSVLVCQFHLLHLCLVRVCVCAYKRLCMCVSVCVSFSFGFLCVFVCESMWLRACVRERVRVCLRVFTLLVRLCFSSSSKEFMCFLVCQF